MIILSNKSKTMRQLSRESGIPVIYSPTPNSIDFLVRWGNTRPQNALQELNKLEAVQTAIDKPKCRSKLRENGLNVPMETQTNYPVLGRPRNHSQGQGFYVCYNSYDVERAKERGAVYFSKFYAKENEYRVHVASNRVLLFSQKLGNTDNEIWNYKNGFTFKHLHRSTWLQDELLTNIQRQCKRAIQAIELDFGAIDVFTANNSFYISEINTAPALSPLARQKYIAYFKQKEMEVRA